MRAVAPPATDVALPGSGTMTGRDGAVEGDGEAARLADAGRLLLAAPGIALVRTDASARVDRVSAGAERLFGGAAADLQGRELQRLLPEYPPAVVGERAAAAAPDWAVERGISWGVRVGGERFPVDVSLARLGTEPCRGYLVMLGDPAWRAEYRERLEHLAYHDVITGLPNRAFLLDRLERALERPDARVAGPALLFVDLDGFKQINDDLGHDHGDRVLGVLGRRLATAVRPQDIIARYGGDEFVILMESVGSDTDAERAATRVVERLRQPVRVAERSFDISVSVGVARYPRAGRTAEALLATADGAMYAAKAAGGDGFRRAPPAAPREPGPNGRDRA